MMFSTIRYLGQLAEALAKEGTCTKRLLNLPRLANGVAGLARKLDEIASTCQPETVHNVGMTVRRLKTYAGAQGYVYQYYFVGKRSALPDDPEAPATEFVFDVTSDRKLTYAVSVFLPQGSVQAWAAAHGRSLTETEQYASAKLRLFRGFDETQDLNVQGRRLVINPPLLEEALNSLGVE